MHGESCVGYSARSCTYSMKFPSLIHRIHPQIKSKYHYLSLQSALEATEWLVCESWTFRFTLYPCYKPETRRLCVQFPSCPPHALPKASAVKQCQKLSYFRNKIKERICNCKWFNINSSASFCIRIGSDSINVNNVNIACSHKFPVSCSMQRAYKSV